MLAIQRQGEDLPSGAPLAAGDTLLLQGTWEAIDARLDPAEVLVVDSPDLVRRQALPMGPGAKTTLVILAAMVVLLATGLVPAAVAGLLAGGGVPAERHPQRRTDLPVDQLDDRDPRRRDDAAVDRDPADGRGGASGAKGSSASSATAAPASFSRASSC